MDLYSFLNSFPPTRDGILNNRWLWFHTAGGVGVAWVATLLGVAGWACLVIPGALLFAYEVYQVGWKHKLFLGPSLRWRRIETVYGSRSAWFWDSLCDVVCPLVLAAMVVF